MTSHGKRENGERGAAAVEFALLLPITIMLVCGMIDLGVWLNQRITVNEAARQGVRAYVLAIGDEAAKQDAVTDVVERTLGVGDYAVTTTACAKEDDDDPVAIASVTISLDSAPLVGLVPGFDTVTLRSRAAMACAE
ncbi:hypothetical protein GCM10027589_31010 [Actinocorallia lasiicapitis]